MTTILTFKVKRFDYQDWWGQSVDPVYQVQGMKALTKTEEFQWLDNGYTKFQTPVFQDMHGTRYLNVASGIGYSNPAMYRNLDDPEDKSVWCVSLPSRLVDEFGNPVDKELEPVDRHGLRPVLR